MVRRADAGEGGSGGGLTAREWLLEVERRSNEPDRSLAARTEALLFHAMVLARRCLGSSDKKTADLAQDLRRRLDNGGW